MSISVTKLKDIICAESDLADSHLDQLIHTLSSIAEETTALSEIDVDDLARCIDTTGKKLVFTLKAIAEYAKKEENRTPLTHKTIFDHLTVGLASDNPEQLIQSCRCIGNICNDNDAGREMFLDADGVIRAMDVTKHLLTNISDSMDEQTDKSVVILCNCLVNVVCDNVKLQEAFIEHGAVPLLLQYITKCEKISSQICTLAITAMSILLDTNTGLNTFIQDNSLDGLSKMLIASKDEEIQLALVEMFTDIAKKQPGLDLLCKSPLIPSLVELINAHSDAQEEAGKEKVFKQMVDLVVVVSSAETGFDLLCKTYPDALSHCVTWLQSPNKHLQISGGLGIGNYARSEESCAELVNKGIHTDLIKLIEDNLEDEEFVDRCQAFISALRNMCIPVTNKPVLIDARLADISALLIKKSIVPIKFKAIACLRLLVGGSVELACKLCKDKEMVDAVVDLSKRPEVIGVSCESQRLIAVMAKLANNSDSSKQLIESGGEESILLLLKSEHQLMRNEGLIGIIMLLTTYEESLTVLLAAEFLSILKNLITNCGGDPQTLFNAITAVLATLSSDAGRAALVSINMADTLSTLKGHPHDLVKAKAEETLELLNSS